MYPKCEITTSVAAMFNSPRQSREGLSRLTTLNMSITQWPVGIYHGTTWRKVAVILCSRNNFKTILTHCFSKKEF